MKKLLSIMLIIVLVFAVSCSSTVDEDLKSELEAANKKIENLQDMADQVTGLEDDKLALKVKLTDLEEMAAKDQVDIEELRASNERLMEELTQAESKADDLALQVSELDSQELTLNGPVVGASLLSEASQIVYLMSLNNFTDLSAYVDPVDGLRLSPYQYVNTASDLVLTAGDIATFASYPMANWGVFDGSGDPINLNGLDYYNQFVYNADFNLAPYVGQNTVLSSGNMINNINSVYPGASFVEFYYDGFDPNFEGMDWTSLTLVMKNTGGQWYLIGVIHGQWTI